MSELKLVDVEGLKDELEAYEQLCPRALLKIVDEFTHTPTWIPVSERLPERGETIFLFQNWGIFRTRYTGGSLPEGAFWAPRYVQEPPELPEETDAE